MSAPFQLLHYEERGPVAIITYDRQERRNAWNVPMYRETVAAVARANANEAVRALIITNAGPVFCSGFDFKAPPEPKDPATGRSPRISTLTMARDQSWVHVMQRSKPVIAAVNGAAVGIGATQILSADIRIASARSSFSFPFVALGHLPELGSSALLPRIVGLGRAMDLCLSAGKIDAAEALRIGLVTRVVEETQLLDAALTLANQIASYPALPVKLTKGLMYGNALEGDPNLFVERETEAFVTAIKARRQEAALTEHPPGVPES